MNVFARMGSRRLHAQSRREEEAVRRMGSAMWPLAVVMLGALSAAATSHAQTMDESKLQVVMLAEDPSPESLVGAKQALAGGAVVVMRGTDWRRFDGLLDVGLRPEGVGDIGPGVGSSARALRIMALHLGPEHGAHGYICSLVPAPRKKDTHRREEQCEEAFVRWLQEESGVGVAAPPEPLAGDYTPLFRIENDTAWGYGTYYDRIRLYRVNDKEPTRDWYLVMRDPATAPDFEKCTNSNLFAKCGWITEKRDFQTALGESFRGNPNFTYFEASPSRNLGGNGSLSIGAGLSGFVPFAGVEYNLSWGQERVETKTYLNSKAKEASWVEDFGSSLPFSRETPTNRQYFQSHNAMIYQVPEGTSEFHVALKAYIENRFYNPDKPAYRGFFWNYLLLAPQFSVSTQEITLLPKGKAYIQLTAAVPQVPYLPPDYYVGGLSWTAQLGVGTEGFAVSQSKGSGSTLLTVTAPSAPPGREGTLELNTNPPYAAASVVKSPLIVKLKVANGVAARVLLAGGRSWSGETLSSAEQWDPATGKSILTAPMTARRRLHTATQLEDGRVLITGGANESSTALASTEFFTPGANTFTAGPSMLAARAEHTATLIKSGALAGDVLIAGGSDASGNALKNAELYDPRTNRFTWTADMLRTHMRHTATAMVDGRILVAGGTLARESFVGIGETEIFDPSTQKWSRAGNLQEGRQGHAAALLTTGQVLVAGGWYPSATPIATAELYTPASNTFSYTLRPMQAGRRHPAAAPLLDGDVLVAGGEGAPYNGERFRPAPETFRSLGGHMLEQRERPTATLLLNTSTALDKQVMFAGGVTPGTGPFDGKLIEVFDPDRELFAPSGMMTTSRSEMTATLVGTFY